MGVFPSKIDLSKDQEDKNYKAGYLRIDVNVEEYQQDPSFKKYTQKINYVYTYDQVFFNLYFYLSFIKTENKDRVIYYYISKERDIVDKIEIFYSKKHPDVPIILGFKTRGNNDFKYYSFAQLKEAYSLNGLPKTGGFEENELKDKLNEENKKVNQIEFVKDGRTQNCDVKLYETRFNDFLQCMYFTNEKRPHQSHVLSTDKLLEHEKRDEPIDYSFLNDVYGKSFDYVYVYYTKQNKVAVLIEFEINDIKKHFKRNSLDGNEWINQGVNYFNEAYLEPQLKIIKNTYESRICYRLNKNVNDLSYKTHDIKIVVEKNHEHKYTIHKHTPSQTSNLTSTKISYNKKSLTIVPNTTIAKKQDKLKSLDGKLFTEICTYCLQTNTDEHLLLKLTTKNRDEYYLYRFGKDNSQWKPLDKNHLLEINLINSSVVGVRMGFNEDQALGKLISRYLNESKSDNIKALLLDISSSINSIVSIINYKYQYKKANIDELMSKNKEIPPLYSDVNGVYVENVNDYKSESCSKIPGFSLYKHDLGKSADMGELKPKKSALYMRLYSGNTRIILFEDSKAEEKPCYLTYSSSSQYLYVYFCDDGKDPLLFLYNLMCYRPKEKDSNKWVKVPDIKSCDKFSEEALKRELEQLKKSYLCQKQTPKSPGFTQQTPPSQGDSRSSSTPQPAAPSPTSPVDTSSSSSGGQKETTKTLSPETKAAETIEAPGTNLVNTSPLQPAVSDNNSVPKLQEKGLHDSGRPTNNLKEQSQPSDRAESDSFPDVKVSESDEGSENKGSYGNNGVFSGGVYSFESTGQFGSVDSSSTGQDSSEGSIWEKIKNFFEEHQDAVLGASISVVGCGFCGYGLYLLLQKK